MDKTHPVRFKYLSITQAVRTIAADTVANPSDQPIAILKEKSVIGNMRNEQLDQSLLMWTV